MLFRDSLTPGSSEITWKSIQKGPGGLFFSSQRCKKRSRLPFSLCSLIFLEACHSLLLFMLTISPWRRRGGGMRGTGLFQCFYVWCTSQKTGEERGYYEDPLLFHFVDPFQLEGERKRGHERILMKSKIRKSHNRKNVKILRLTFFASCFPFFLLLFVERISCISSSLCISVRQQQPPSTHLTFLILKNNNR